ncbi:iron-containing redox enzyme family protein [Amycolatopsis cynarae]|uniref:Iron-containing redox enzyme family protein n=1 Tax=Amycolatopsis cynarae TaxID=2995223 RepID=A0ABY7B9M5_9PSEU|nr:iron-containing redox enzyme family protein [Amycolatopsis sp. HUAS 11-8]WAL68639.1 iron-containing redox enzyme family protein [Amycolatopsis sp. HUAS 11-8]
MPAEMPARPTFVPPDTTTALPKLGFHFSAKGREEAMRVLSAGPAGLFRALLHDQESESTLLVARQVLEAFLIRGRELAAKSPEAGTPSRDFATTVAALVERARDELATELDALDELAVTDPDVRTAVLRQRGVLGLLAGCWLDVVSQPATQPAVVVNRLFAQHFALRGAGDPRRSARYRRARALEDADAALPDVAAADFLERAQARDLTILLGCFPLALAVLPANFLPEVVGVHYAFHALGVDDRLLGTPPPLPESELRELLAEYARLAGDEERDRLFAAVVLTLALEREHVAMLGQLAEFRKTQPLESKVAEIFARHAPLAGRQHGRIRVGGLPLVDIFDGFGRVAGQVDETALAEFLAEFRESPYLKARRDGDCRFLAAIRFGGPMFGIFSTGEARVLAEWVASVQAGERPDIVLPPNTAGEHRARYWREAIAAARPADVVVSEEKPVDHRELFYRLVNIENFANTLSLAAERAEKCFQDAEILFAHGAGGRYTDASFFEYSPDALYQRAERIYWEKLVDPFEPLAEIPDVDEVLFRQNTYHLTYLIDGAWLHRLGRLGRQERESDNMLFAIYADEMGNGDVRKNHLTLTRRALASMDIRLPHIRTAEFMDQDELPDDLYGFALQQLCMCLFPDRFHNEILGYNLAIEMFGSGEMRLHEIQKLRHHGFDDCYEQAHLTIDNFSAGHAKQAADIIVAYLDRVRRTSGDGAIAEEWRRIWRGYASFAYFLEQPMLKELAARQAAEPVRETTAELVL